MTPTPTSVVPFQTFRDLLHSRFNGLLLRGKHKRNSQACTLELAHAAVGDAWSDTPDKWPDLRALNDAPWSNDLARTAGLVPVMEAYWEWDAWPRTRQVETITRLAILTVQRIIADLPDLPAAVRTQCRAVATLKEAAQAAWGAAQAAAGAWAAQAAEAAAGAAQVAALAWAAQAVEAVAWAAQAAAQAAGAAVAAAAQAVGAVAGAEVAAAGAADAVLQRACACWIEAAAMKAEPERKLS